MIRGAVQPDIASIPKWIKWTQSDVHICCPSAGHPHPFLWQMGHTVKDHWEIPVVLGKCVSILSFRTSGLSQHMNNLVQKCESLGLVVLHFKKIGQCSVTDTETM